MSSSAEHAAALDAAPAAALYGAPVTDEDSTLASSAAPAEAEQVRHYTSAKARHTLEGIFRHKPYPSPEMCKNLAKQFGCMTPKQVQNWFQNRRQREKKLASLNPAVATPSPYMPQMAPMRVQYAMPHMGYAPMGWAQHGAMQGQPMAMAQPAHPPLPYMLSQGGAVVDASGQYVHYAPPPPAGAHAPSGQQPAQQQQQQQQPLHLVPSTMVPQFAPYAPLPPAGAARPHAPMHSLYGIGSPWQPRGA
ncbi:hypothetical protein KFE25_012174 [Diacronema lutheri]|uniref:Homeobox domain-containing protein n=1 Tax=Diacronema lutheri TaxID=2081491 RepID=A0A7R9YMN0_DIALT|nr:hypothetical protein KFE25_012174 [Diacronema lutheri]|mmetsp:Transcript_4885/g.15143  ORF Transcript_4885/g.15143 Transcript_4885/m.15143 type:complete len:248 (+) Transcript_4885:38-781(+)